MKTKPNKRDIEIELLQQKQAKQGLSGEEKDMLITKLSQRLDFLDEQFRLAQHKRFASQNEAHPGQDDLFNEVEDIAEFEREQADSEEKQPTQKKKRTLCCSYCP